MIDKDKTIVRLLEKLKGSINFDAVEIVDYWDADLCATGLKKGNKLVYISTYNSCLDNQDGVKEIKYDYDFELLNEKDMTELHVTKEARRIDEATLIRDIKQFLKV